MGAVDDLRNDLDDLRSRVNSSLDKFSADLEVAVTELGGTTVSDNPVTSVTVTYADDTSVTFESPASDSPAPVVTSVEDPTPANTDGGTSSDTVGDAPVDEAPAAPPAEGATEVAPTVAGVVPE